MGYTNLPSALRTFDEFLLPGTEGGKDFRGIHKLISTSLSESIPGALIGSFREVMNTCFYV